MKFYVILYNIIFFLKILWVHLEICVFLISLLKWNKLTNKLSKNGYFKAQNILFTKCLWYFIAKAFPPPKKKREKKREKKSKFAASQVTVYGALTATTGQFQALVMEDFKCQMLISNGLLPFGVRGPPLFSGVTDLLRHF